jgi:hypothetical protein
MVAILESGVAMPTDKTKQPVVNLALAPEFLAQIDEYRFERRFRSRVAAMKYLLDWALQHNPEPTPADHERWS